MKKAGGQHLLFFPLENIFHFLGPFELYTGYGKYGDSVFYYFSPINIVFFKNVIHGINRFTNCFRHCTGEVTENKTERSSPHREKEATDIEK